MNISFPINNFSHVFNLMSDLFELDIDTHSQTNSFSFEWDGNKFSFYETTTLNSSINPEITIELFHIQHSLSEITKRLELYCYRNQTQQNTFNITLDASKYCLTWKISSIVKLEVYFTPEAQKTESSSVLFEQ